jgi:S-DNA-T family DNA segregation ATPase FtsK/SpoIIIE
VQVADPGRLAEVAARLPAAASRPPWRVQTLPAEVGADALPAATLDAGLQVPVAVAEDDLSPVALDLFDKDHAILAGPPRSGRTSALRLIAAQVRAADPRTVLVGVCTERSALHGDAALDAAGTAQELERVLRIGVTDRRRWVVLVDDAGQVTDDRGALARLLACGRSQLHVVAAGRTEDFRSLSHWSRGARRSRHGVLLQPDLTTDGDVLSVRLPRRIPVQLRPGRGFVVVGGTARLAQLALPTPVAGAAVRCREVAVGGALGLVGAVGARGTGR